MIRRKANATIQCPVKEGEYVIEQTADLPKEIPPGASVIPLSTQPRLIVHIGKFNINIHGYSVDDEELVCLNMAVDFRRFPHFW